MAPPGAVIIPDVVIGVAPAYPDGQFGGLHNAYSFSDARIRDCDKKATLSIRMALFRPGFFCSARLRPHIAWRTVSLRATVGFPVPGWQVLHNWQNRS
jgi:hypothetical protein